MPDLRERLRAIESTPPPDLWTAIEARALEDRPESGTEVVAFEPRRPEWRRRLAAAAVAAAVSVLAGILVWRAFAPTPTPPIVPKPLDVPAGWERCENPVVGYTIGYPGEYFTTDVLSGEQDPSFACRWFLTEPFGPDGSQVLDGYGYPLEVGYRTQGLDVVVADQTNDESVRVLSTETTSVAGHRAVRLEVEFTNSVLIAPGTVLYEYAIELMPDRTLVVLTVDQQGIPGTYQENRRVVDLAVSTLRFADPLPGALPAGWQRCTNVEQAFDVGYPGDWYTTDVFFGERRQADACTHFASVPFELQTETGEPFGVAAEEGCGYPICLRFVPESLDQLVEETHRSPAYPGDLAVGRDDQRSPCPGAGPGGARADAGRAGRALL